MVAAILEDLKPQSGDQVAVMVNGLGATPPEELYIIYRKAYDILADKGISVYRAYVGEYATSMEMAGASITIMRLDDELSRTAGSSGAVAVLRADVVARQTEGACSQEAAATCRKTTIEAIAAKQRDNHGEYNSRSGRGRGCTACEPRCWSTRLTI